MAPVDADTALENLFDDDDDAEMMLIDTHQDKPDAAWLPCVHGADVQGYSGGGPFGSYGDAHLLPAPVSLPIPFRVAQPFSQSWQSFHKPRAGLHLAKRCLPAIPLFLHPFRFKGSGHSH